jgi:mRNA interferase RelE/StbE
MASFNVQWQLRPGRIFARPPREVQRILIDVEALPENPFPHGSEKLAGTEHTYRIRVGDYRIIYEVFVDSKILEIQRVRHRKDVYRK